MVILIVLLLLLLLLDLAVAVAGVAALAVKAVLFDVYFLDDVYLFCFHFLFSCCGISISRWLDA